MYLSVFQVVSYGEGSPEERREIRKSRDVEEIVIGRTKVETDSRSGLESLG